MEGYSLCSSVETYIAEKCFELNKKPKEENKIVW